MRTVKGETRDPAVVKVPAAPGGGNVAPGTIGGFAQRALVMVIFMTTDTCHALGTELSIGVAFLAGQGLVAAEQGKTRHRMVEPDGRFPARHSMARRAIAAETAMMRIVVAAVATFAFHWRLYLQQWPLVAPCAGDTAVPADERKSSQPVVVEALGSPGFDPVARCTIRTVLALMRISRAVAANACRRRLRPFHGQPVTVYAVYFDVSADQREPGVAVVLKRRELPSNRCVA